MGGGGVYSLWSVNLSHNWAFNVWTVDFIKTPTAINTQVNCNSYCLFWTLCVLWLAEEFTDAHTLGETSTHRHFTPSYLICMCLSESQNMLANHTKSCSIVGELASSPWRVGGSSMRWKNGPNYWIDLSPWDLSGWRVISQRTKIVLILHIHLPHSFTTKDYTENLSIQSESWHLTGVI